MEEKNLLSQNDLLALVECAKSLSSEIDFSDLLSEVLGHAEQLTDSRAGSVILYDSQRNGLYFAAATGPKAGDVLRQFGESGPDRIPVWNNDKSGYASVAGKVFDTGEFEIKDSVVDDSGHFKGVDQGAHHQTESMICVPLSIGKERLGVVQLLNKAAGNYNPRDRVLLQDFSSHAAVAVRNARYIRDLLAHKGLFTSSAEGIKTADLLAELEAPAREEIMTVVFADMRGFTRLSQVLGHPKEIETHLNDFLTLLSTQVNRHDGLVNKFLGDGVLGLFRGPDCAVRAIRAAFAILASFAELCDRWNQERSEDMAFLDVGVGIATGNVVIGSIGSGSVKDFTALGNTVNLAAAFEREARGGRRVLIDQVTLNGVQEIVADMDEATIHELRKTDQPAGVAFKCYHIRRLRPEISDAVVVVKANADPQTRLKSLSDYYHNSWAVVVGIDTFKSSRIGHLTYAVADAQAVAQALPRAGFPPERIELLLNERASKEAILQAIYGKLVSTNRDDRLLVFFALHGELLKHQKGEEGYLLPYDTDPSNLPLTALPMAEFAQIGRRLPPKHILFVLDTCFSGYAVKRGVHRPENEADLRLLTNESVVQLLTAGTASQRTIEEGGNGIFTRSFLKGLEGFADQEGTGLTALKLAVYIQERVVAASRNTQTPQYAKLDGDGEFLFLPPR